MSLFERLMTRRGYIPTLPPKPVIPGPPVTARPLPHGALDGIEPPGLDPLVFGPGYGQRDHGVALAVTCGRCGAQQAAGTGACWACEP